MKESSSSDGDASSTWSIDALEFTMGVRLHGRGDEDGFFTENKGGGMGPGVESPWLNAQLMIRFVGENVTKEAWESDIVTALQYFYCN